MADESTTGGITPVTPGVETSEYAVTKWTQILGWIAFAVGIGFTVLTKLTEIAPGLTWVGPVLSVVAIINNLLAQLGYNKGRVLVKTSKNTGALAPTPPTT